MLVSASESTYASIGMVPYIPTYTYHMVPMHAPCLGREGRFVVCGAFFDVQYVMCVRACVPIYDTQNGRGRKTDQLKLPQIFTLF